MSSSNKATTSRLYTEISRGNLDSIDELLAPDFVEHEAVPGVPPTREGVRQLFEKMRTGFPDFQFTVEDMIAEDDKVFVRATMHGTHGGTFMDIPGSGKSITVPVADFFRLNEGLIVEHWGYPTLAQ